MPVQTNIPVEAIARIVRQYEAEEERHFEECTKREQRSHIFNDIRAVRSWLDGIEARAA